MLQRAFPCICSDDESPGWKTQNWKSSLLFMELKLYQIYTTKEVFGCNIHNWFRTCPFDLKHLGWTHCMYGYPKQKFPSCLNLNLKIQTWNFKFGGRTTLTPLITSILKVFKTMNSSLRYDSYKFALQMLNPTNPEGKCEFEWPHTLWMTHWLTLRMTHGL